MKCRSLQTTNRCSCEDNLECPYTYVFACEHRETKYVEHDPVAPDVCIWMEQRMR